MQYGLKPLPVNLLSYYCLYLIICLVTSYSIWSHISELISVLGSQPAGDVSHKPTGRLPLLSTRPVVTPTTLSWAVTSFAAWWTEAQWVWIVCPRLLPDSATSVVWPDEAVVVVQWQTECSAQQQGYYIMFKISILVCDKYKLALKNNMNFQWVLNFRIKVGTPQCYQWMSLPEVWLYKTLATWKCHHINFLTHLAGWLWRQVRVTMLLSHDFLRNLLVCSSTASRKAGRS